MTKITKFENKNFVQLHNHTEYSPFDGMAALDGMVMKAREMGFPALAVTDHGSVGGLIKLIQKCRMTKDKKGKEIPHDPIKPILGCLLAGQEIVTLHGVKSVEDIQVGDMVLTHKGRFRKVLNIMTRKHAGQLYDINLSAAKRSLTLTDEHPILVRDVDGNVDWKKPGEIQAGRQSKKGGIKNWLSYVCLPKLKKSKKKIYINVEPYLPDTLGVRTQYIYKTAKKSKYETMDIEWKNVNKNIELTEDFAYFLGLYVAEGSAQDNGQVNLSFHIDEVEYMDFCVDFIKKEWGIDAKIHRRPDRNLAEVYFCCLPLAWLLNGICGKYAKNKRVPEAIFSASRNLKDKFIRGLIDGDGKDINKVSNVFNQETLRVSSRNLAWGFRQLLADIGHWVSVDYDYNEELDKHTYTVPYNPLRKYARSLEDDKYVYKPIKSIASYEDEVDVFNFEVEEDNSYVSDFILHNCEFYLSLDHEARDKATQPSGRKGNYHITVHAKNWEGYQNLCTLLDIGWRQGYYYDPRIDFDLLSKHSKGLIVSSGCPGSIINANLMHGRYKEAKKICTLMKDVFKEDFFIELMYHGLRIESQIIPEALKIASELSLPYYCSNDTHYIEKSQAGSHDVFLCMSMRKCIADPNRISFPYKEFYLKSAQEMGSIFGDIPKALWNTKEVADRVDMDDIAKHLFGGMRLPKYKIPENYNNAYDYMEVLAWDGLKDLGWHNSPDHVQALKKELADVKIALDNNGYDFATYFLIVRDYIIYAKSQNVVVGCGRGSGFASVLLRCLKIAYGPDPLKYGLWERFLGFDDKRFIKKDGSDFGIEDALKNIDKLDNIVDNIVESDEEIEEEISTD